MRNTPSRFSTNADISVRVSTAKKSLPCTNTSRSRTSVWARFGSRRGRTRGRSAQPSLRRLPMQVTSRSSRDASRHTCLGGQKPLHGFMWIGCGMVAWKNDTKQSQTAKQLSSLPSRDSRCCFADQQTGHRHWRFWMTSSTLVGVQLCRHQPTSHASLPEVVEPRQLSSFFLVLQSLARSRTCHAPS